MIQSLQEWRIEFNAMDETFQLQLCKPSMNQYESLMQRKHTFYSRTTEIHRVTSFSLKVDWIRRALISYHELFSGNPTQILVSCKIWILAF